MVELIILGCFSQIFVFVFMLNSFKSVSPVIMRGGESSRRKIMNEKYDFENRVPSEGRHKANQRERVRTCSVNAAFTMLRNLIPTDPADRKLSKIETLRLACSYISHLGSILMTGSCEVSTSGKFICTFCVTSAKIKTDLYHSILN